MERLDKFLSDAGVASRRDLKALLKTGVVQINGRPAKAGTEVKVGDHLTIQFGNKDVNVEVLDVQETVHKENAGELYKYI